MSIKSMLNNSLPGVRIVGMHYLADEPDRLSDCVINKDNFEMFISDKRFVSIENAIIRPAFCKGAYCITIDDGLADLYEIYRIVKKRGIPIAAFVSSRLLDEPGYITTEEIKEMAKDPLVTIGSHGCTHIKLSEAQEKTAREEITISKAELENIIKKEITLFAYPNGAATKREIGYVKRAGYSFALGVAPRKHTFITRAVFPYLLPRFNLTDATYETI